MKRTDERDNIRRQYAALLRREGELLRQLRAVRALLPDAERQLKQADESVGLGPGRGQQPHRDVAGLTPEAWVRRAAGRVEAKAAEAEAEAAAERRAAQTRCLATRRVKDRIRRKATAAA